MDRTNLFKSKTKMVIKKNKNKINIVDGYISYPLTFADNSIRCPCITNTNIICSHITFYLEAQGMDLNLLDHWIRIKEHVMKYIKNYQCIDNDNLWMIVDEEIKKLTCGFCLGCIKSDFNVCMQCQGIIHSTCFKKWDQLGNGCMLCRTKT